MSFVIGSRMASFGDPALVDDNISLTGPTGAPGPTGPAGPAATGGGGGISGTAPTAINGIARWSNTGATGLKNSPVIIGDDCSMTNDGVGTYFQLRNGDIVMGYGAGSSLMDTQNLLIIGRHALKEPINAYATMCLGNYNARYASGINNCISIGDYVMYYGYHDSSVTIGYGSVQATMYDVANVTIGYRSEKYVSSYRNVLIGANIGYGEAGDNTLVDSIIIGESAISNGQATVLSLGNTNFKNAVVKSLGAGTAATFGTIGGYGPDVAGQNSWLQLIIGGSVFYIPLWV